MQRCLVQRRHLRSQALERELRENTTAKRALRATVYGQLQHVSRREADTRVGSPKAHTARAELFLFGVWAKTPYPSSAEYMFWLSLHIAGIYILCMCIPVCGFLDHPLATTLASSPACPQANLLAGSTKSPPKRSSACLSSTDIASPRRTGDAGESFFHCLTFHAAVVG